MVQRSGKKGGYVGVAQITTKQCKKYPGLSHIDLERPSIVIYCK